MAIEPILGRLDFVVRDPQLLTGQFGEGDPLRTFCPTKFKQIVDERETIGVGEKSGRPNLESSGYRSENVLKTVDKSFVQSEVSVLDQMESFVFVLSHCRSERPFDATRSFWIDKVVQVRE